MKKYTALLVFGCMAQNIEAGKRVHVRGTSRRIAGNINKGKANLSERQEEEFKKNVLRKMDRSARAEQKKEKQKRESILTTYDQLVCQEVPTFCMCPVEGGEWFPQPSKTTLKILIGGLVATEDQYKEFQNWVESCQKITEKTSQMRHAGMMVSQNK